MNSTKDIVILETPIDDDIIEQLKSADDGDVELKLVIDAYVNALEDNRTEIYFIGNDFIVCEEAIYIAIYQEDLSEEFELTD